MMTAILSARQLHTLPGMAPLRTAGDYRALQLAFLRQQNARGIPVAPHADSTVRVAFITGGDWKVSCPCGNAPATDPEWCVAYCFTCGAQYDRVVFPDTPTRLAIERVLGRRPGEANRNWLPTETLAELEQENLAHGVAI